VFEWYVADATGARHPTVEGVVSGVSHHEIMACRDNKGFFDVFETATLIAIERVVAHAVRQRFVKLFDWFIAPARTLADVVFDLLAVDRIAVNNDLTTQHLDAVPRQTDHALDVVGGVIVRQTKNDDIATLWFRAEDA